MSLLASVRPTATTETVLYTVPASKKAIINITVAVAAGNGPASIRIGIQETAGAFASKDYILYDYNIYGGELPVQITGIALSASQSVRVYVSSAVVNFHVNGIVENM